jgi:two-component system phosphate regulon response regulator OmpR
MLTARGDPVDRIVGLEMGADDYLAKPFNPRELAARISAMLRRQSMLGAGKVAVHEELVHFGPFTLNEGQRQLLRDGKVLECTTGEYALLRAFVANPNRPLGRERLIELAKGRDHEATDRSIDVQILRLRRLIETDPSQPRYIKTVWGVGYVFIPAPASV